MIRMVMNIARDPPRRDQMNRDFSGIPTIFILQVALVAVLAYLNVLPPFFCA